MFLKFSAVKAAHIALVNFNGLCEYINNFIKNKIFV